MNNISHEFSSAVWVESPVCGGPRTPVPAPWFRAEFSLAAPPRRAHLHITALGLYRAELNGQRVGDEVFAPGWTDVSKRLRTQVHEVTHLLRGGENALGVVLGDGWACGHVANLNRQLQVERPKLLARLEWEDERGGVGERVTDAGWLTATGPLLANDLIMGEAYDARLEMEGWSSPGFDATGWGPVRLSPALEVRLEPHAGPVVRRQECFPAREITPEGTPIRIRRYDLGQNISGRVRLTVRGARGVTLRLRHAEVLDASGALYTANLRGAAATDFYTLRGGEAETWEPEFTFHGFRFVEVYWTEPGPVGEVLSLEGVALYNDMPRTGVFACSHPLLNQLYENIVWGQKGNFLEAPTDCPQRDERLGWTGDAQVFARSAAFNMDVSAFFRKWLGDLRDAQRPSGAIPPFAPHVAAFGLPEDGGPAWADVVCLLPWEMYRVYGDPAVLAENIDAMRGYMRYLADHKVKEGIRAHPEVDAWGGFGDWLALDGGGKTEGITPKDLIGTAFYCRNAEILADGAGILGREDEAREWRALRSRSVGAFQNRFLEKDGTLRAATQTACALALRFDLVPPDTRDRVGAQLVSLLEANGCKIGTGFVGTPHLLHVLEDLGRLDLAYRLLEEEGFPSWLFPVTQGATTVWERWDGWHPERGFQSEGMNSFNHYAYGAVCDWMVETVAGLVPDLPGYRRVLFKPRPGGTLTRASAQLDTALGRTGISWELTGNLLALELTVPEGGAGRVDLGKAWVLEGAMALPPGTHALTASRA